LDKAVLRAFTDRVFADMAGTMTAGMVFVGTKTGLFRAMAGKGPMRVDQVVQASGLQPRYVEEWLRGMTAARYLAYDAAKETFELPDEHAYLLASEGTDHFAGGLFAMAPVLMRIAPDVATAFEKGGGVHFEHFGADGVEALDLINRGNYEHRLASYWLPAMPDVVRKLEDGGRVLDVGCGAGRVCIAIAKSFPAAKVTGIDPDAESISQARSAAAAQGVGDRIRFLAQTTADVRADGGFDLVTLCDALHDLAAPREILEQIRSLLRPDGTLFIIEPKAADRLEDNINPIATMFYGFSIFHCMTQSLARGGPGLGTCLGPARTEAIVRAAGFREFELLDIRSQVNLFYAARA
jgi:2-polyprenyl-3-methyl-5-hydroxy-6-metoxy-1,4-benzoquinol methylase